MFSRALCWFTTWLKEFKKFLQKKPCWIQMTRRLYGKEVITVGDGVEVSVHELVTDGTLIDIYKSFNKSLFNLCLSPAEVVEFIMAHRNKLHPTSGTFFLSWIDCVFRINRADIIDDGPPEFESAELEKNGAIVLSHEYRYRFIIPL